MKKKRVLVAHPRVTAAGGSNGVAAWVLEALRESCDLSLATLQPVDYAAVNRSFGTSLRAGDFTLHVAPPHYQNFLRYFPTQGALLEACLTMRLAQNLDRRHHYDLLFGTQNEADFGRRGLHYVHHPWLYLPRPKDEIRWFHYIPGVLAAYRGFCGRIAGVTQEGLRRNLSLANSRFIAGRIRQVHGVDSEILYPPVPGVFPEIPWEQRVAGFVAVGRIHSCKRWDMAVAILDEVRRRGCELSLTLIGHRDYADPLRQLQALQAGRPWFRIPLDLSREELEAEVACHRYGIHAMLDEHFGMAPAQIQRAGCILFVHRSGGPVEIVGGDERLLFDTVDDDADKIVRAVTDPAVEADLRRHVAAQRERFSVEAFCTSLRDIVEHFE
jgi:glycosyltransferase involved in cell wall biosynthesis